MEGHDRHEGANPHEGRQQDTGSAQHIPMLRPGGEWIL